MIIYNTLHATSFLENNFIILLFADVIKNCEKRTLWLVVEHTSTYF